MFTFSSVLSASLAVAATAIFAVLVSSFQRRHSGESLDRFDEIDRMSARNSARFYVGEMTEDEDVANRSYLLRERLIAAGELRRDQPGRPLLVTAMRRETKVAA